jgi:hypothetical protein
MLTLETKHSGDKLNPHSDFRGECFYGNHRAAYKEKRKYLRGTLGVSIEQCRLR